MKSKDRREANDALEVLAKAAQIRQAKAGKYSLAYAASLHQLGQAHLIIRLPGEARNYLQASVALRERLAGKKSHGCALKP